MKKAISLQPYVSTCSVHIDRAMISENPFHYDELRGSMIQAQVEISYQGMVAAARLQFQPASKYPLMRLLEVQAIKAH